MADRSRAGVVDPRKGDRRAYHVVLYRGRGGVLVTVGVPLLVETLRATFLWRCPYCSLALSLLPAPL